MLFDKEIKLSSLSFTDADFIHTYKHTHCYKSRVWNVIIELKQETADNWLRSSVLDWASVGEEKPAEACVEGMLSLQ